MALLGPIARPDGTPKSNDQILEITTKAPGFTVEILKVKKNQKEIEVGFWDYVSIGVDNDFSTVPIYDYSFEGYNLVVEKYTGSSVNNGQIVRYNLAEIVYSLDHNEVTEANGFLDFYTLDGGKQHVAIDKLISIIKEDYIISKQFYLGTDKYGRDLLSRLMAGTWISLFVGFISVFISLVIGISFGALAGYYRGWIDDLVMWFINVVWSIPTLLLVIAITMALGKGTWQVFIAVGLTMWVEVARVVRGEFISQRNRGYVESAKMLAFSNIRIIFKHILPNVLGPIIVIAAANFAAAILIEAGLSFLGLGAQPPIPSWGGMIKDHYNYIVMDKAYLAIIPGVSIMLSVLAFMFLGNGLRSALDVKEG